jgi:RNA polymerase sigma-70 factor (ECF subfamily)
MTTDEAVLIRARGGDERAFSELTKRYRAELQVHCYRMLGSVQDAEDVVQETLAAAWRGLTGFEGRASLRAWLYRIATNRCLNARRDARRRPTTPVPPFEPPPPTRHGDLPWLQPYPESLLAGIAAGADIAPGPEARYQMRETIELAFITALQQLPPRQVAVLLLRDVLGFRTAEVAAMLNTTEVAVKAGLQRARATIANRRQTTLAAPTAPAALADELALAQRFADAYQADDIDAVIGLLTDDAWLVMPPAPHEYQGRTAIAGFLEASARWRAGRRFRLVPVRASGQPAFATYYLDEPAGLIVLTVAGDRIGVIHRFLDTSLYRYF